LQDRYEGRGQFGESFIGCDLSGYCIWQSAGELAKQPKPVFVDIDSIDDVWKERIAEYEA